MLSEKKAVSGILSTFLLVGVIVSAFNIQPVSGSGTFCIRADGSIDPPTAPIQRNGDLYFLTDNITSDPAGSPDYAVVVERNNMVLDGSGFIVKGPNAHGGIYLDGTTNVTIQNINIRNFDYGVWLQYSYNNTISEGNMANNLYGIYFYFSSGNSINGNNIKNNALDGISVEYYSNDNRLTGNNIADNREGVYLGESSISTSVIGNTFIDDGLVVRWRSYMNVVENNTVNGRPLVYLEGVADFNVGNAGQVILVRCERIRVENLDLSRASIGIELWETNDTIVSGNDIIADDYGIGLLSCTNDSMSGNTIANNNYGISFGFSSYSSISGNTITDNGYGVYLEGSANNSISTNTVTNNNYGIYVFYLSSDNDVYGNKVTNNSGGIYLYFSPNNSIERNNITNNTNHGIYLFYSSNNGIYVNTITNNRYGVYLEQARNSSIDGNVVTDNYIGIELYNSTSNSIIGNSMTANVANGILLGYSSNNRFYHNNFISNSQQATISPSGYANVWDDGYPLGGNYWSDYSGIDEKSGPKQDQPGSDGMGDTPYVIDGNNRDSLPLVNVGTLLKGDVNYDGIVDVFDAILLAGAFNSIPGSPNWNSNADMNGDNTVDIFDAILLAGNFGKSW